MALSSFNRAGLAGTVIGGDSYWNILTATQTPETVELSWPAAGGSPSSYEISINGVIENVGNVTSYSKTGLVAATLYDFKVRPVFANGSKGGWSFFKNSGPLGFNNATGGTITTVSNYNGTGQTWRIHTFRSNGTFTVTNSASPFSVLLVGNGGSGGGAPVPPHAGGGGGGGGVLSSTRSLTVASYPITVGTTTFDGLTASPGNNGANGTQSAGNGGASGAPTSFGGGAATYYDGGGGGGAGGGGGGGSEYGDNGGPGITSNITGSSLIYGRGGFGGSGQKGYNGGSGKGFPNDQTGGAIIAYRIG